MLALLRRLVRRPAPLLQRRYVSNESRSSMNIKPAVERNVDYVADAEEPSFADMVDFVVDRAVKLCRTTLPHQLDNRALSDEQKGNLVDGIMRVIKPNAAVLAVTFPLRRDNGTTAVRWR